jgi:acyl-CoA thioester hydrolase
VTALFEHVFRVRYHETDPQRRAFNSRYLEYTDVALTEWVRSLGWDYVEFVTAGCDPAVVVANIEFLQPANFDEEIAIGVEVAAVKQSSFVLRFRLRRLRGHDVIATAELVYVNLDSEGGRARPIPERIAKRMMAYQTAGDSELKR